MSNSTNHRSNNSTLANGAAADAATNEEDQLNRINLQALQNRDPYIAKIVDQAQRVCVYKFVAEKRQWVRLDCSGDDKWHSSIVLRNAKSWKEHYLSMKGMEQRPWLFPWRVDLT